MTDFTTRAGFAAADITPPAGTPLSGYPDAGVHLPWAPDAMKGYMGRQAPSSGALDALLVTAAAYESGGGTLVLIGIDSLVVTSAFTAAVREALANDGVDPACVLIGASHTHGGPDLFRWWEQYDDGELEAVTLQRTIDAARRAIAARAPAAVAWGEAPLAHVSVNRRDEAGGPTDPVVRVLKATGEDGSVTGLVVSFACHPVTFDYANLLATADWVHHLRATLEATYPGASVVFLNGVAGNLNPARHPFEPARNIYEPQTLENRPVYWGGQADATRTGRSVGGAAIVAAERATELDWHAPRGTVSRLDLSLKTGDELDRFLDFMALTAEYRAAIAGRTVVTTEVQRIAFGPLQVIGLPGEPFVELGGRVRAAAAPLGPVLVVGFANDDVRYVMTDDAYVEGQYETVGTPLAKGSADALVNHVIGLLPVR